MRADSFRTSARLASLPRQVDERQWLDELLGGETREHFRQVFSVFNRALWQTLQVGESRDGSEATQLEALFAERRQSTDFFAPYGLEGIGMGLCLRPDLALACPTPGAPGELALLSLGAGMGQAFLKTGLEPAPTPFLQDWVDDGFAFFEVLAHRSEFLAEPRRLLRTLPQREHCWSGLGRALWFISATSPERLGHLASMASPAAGEWVWRGIGVALTFTGGVPSETLIRLRTLSGDHEDAIARGVLAGAELQTIRSGEAPCVDDARAVFL